MGRSDFVKCIRHTHDYHKDKSWCGKELSSFDWSFMSIDHAAYAVQQGGRQVPCPECTDAVISQLLGNGPFELELKT